VSRLHLLIAATVDYCSCSDISYSYGFEIYWDSRAKQPDGGSSVLLRGASEDDCQDWMDCIRLAATDEVGEDADAGDQESEARKKRSMSEPFGRAEVSSQMGIADLPAASQILAPTPAVSGDPSNGSARGLARSGGGTASEQPNSAKPVVGDCQ
jgi:hypothetical protein